MTQVSAVAQQTLVAPLLRRLAGLRQALDEEFAYEQAVRWASGLSADAVVEAVHVGSVSYRPDGRCTLRYRIRLAGPRRDCTLLVGVSPGQAGVVVRAFPADPGLPTLPRVVDPVGMLAVLSRVVPGTGRDRGVSRCTVDVVHHPRVGRCVLRYELRPGAAGLAELRHRSLFGKVYADAGHPAVAASVLRLLHRGLPALPGGERVRVPRPLGVVQPLRLGLAEDIGGQAVLPQLLRTALDRRDPAAPHGSTSLYEAVVSAALVAAALHHCPVPAEAHLPVRDLATEWARYRAKLAVVAVVWPEVADDVDRRLTGALTAADAATVTAGDSGASGPRVLAHGDWTPAQVLIDGAGVGLVDVDTVCLAEPALDVGRFLAYLHVAGIRRGGPAAWPLLDALTARFLSAYHAADQSMAGTPAAAPPDRQRFLHRVEAYRAVTLGRMAANACRQLKEDRLRAVVDVLDSPADAATST